MIRRIWKWWRQQPSPLIISRIEWFQPTREWSWFHLRGDRTPIKHRPEWWEKLIQ